MLWFSATPKMVFLLILILNDYHINCRPKTNGEGLHTKYNHKRKSCEIYYFTIWIKEMKVWKTWYSTYRPPGRKPKFWKNLNVRSRPPSIFKFWTKYFKNLIRSMLLSYFWSVLHAYYNNLLRKTTQHLPWSETRGTIFFIISAGCVTSHCRRKS